MAIARQITCIRQNGGKERHERITHVGGYWGPGGTLAIETEASAISQINSGTYKYHVRVGSDDVNVIVIHHYPKNYLRTAPDKTPADNLLSLPTCA